MRTRSGISYGTDEGGIVKMDILPDIRIHERKENTKIKEEKKFKRDLDSLLSLFNESTLKEKDKDMDILDSLFSKININKKKRKYYRRFGYRKKKNKKLK
tara:strand:+ start:90 stop:389 length:300 start_codon:yes stop_codon:yes gene_type:complete